MITRIYMKQSIMSNPVYLFQGYYGTIFTCKKLGRASDKIFEAPNGHSLGLAWFRVRAPINRSSMYIEIWKFNATDILTSEGDT